MRLRLLHFVFIGLAPLPATAQVCEARAGVRPPLALELYTSEGCSSCPPADRWLSSLKARVEVLPLAFQASYGNRPGWVDRSASPEATQRQHE